jgi:hypothetical protein
MKCEILTKMKPTKTPGVIVLCDDNSDIFEWVSDGWNSTDSGTAGTPRANYLFGRVRDIVKDAANVPDAIKRLKAAGFKVSRS